MQINIQNDLFRVAEVRNNHGTDKRITISHHNFAQKSESMHPILTSPPPPFRKKGWKKNMLANVHANKVLETSSQLSDCEASMQICSSENFGVTDHGHSFLDDMSFDITSI